jgi:cell division protein FtsI (penicillin-binding protein 3)
VLANGGLRVRPQIVLCRRKPGQPEERYLADKPVRVIAPENAITMRQMMEGVVLRGTGKGLANLRGYTSGGKTGTAQIFDVKGHVYTHSYNASFLGFAPVADPKIVIVVTLNNTTGGSAGYGGPVAAPVFRQVAMSALRMLDVPKDIPEKDSPTDKVSPERGPSPAGTQAVSSVTPPPVQTDPSAANAAGSPEPNLDRRTFLAAVSERKAPDFRGMSLREVLEESSAAGLPVEVEGTGLARNQDPAPGAPLAGRVRIQFGR